jgi:hypothetical protein
MASKRKDGRTYLRETQPEVWKTAYEMSKFLASELSMQKWPEKSFIFDQFIRELVGEIMGPEGLNEISMLPIAELVPGDDPSAQDAGQLVASIRSVFTAALYDLPDSEFETLGTIDSPQKALLLLVSEIESHNEAARTWIANEGADAVVEALKALVGVTVLMIADRASGSTLEQLTTVEALKSSLAAWGEELS